MEQKNEILENPQADYGVYNRGLYIRVFLEEHLFAKKIGQCGNCGFYFPKANSKSRFCSKKCYDHYIGRGKKGRKASDFKQPEFKPLMEVFSFADIFQAIEDIQEDAKDTRKEDAKDTKKESPRQMKTQQILDLIAGENLTLQEIAAKIPVSRQYLHRLTKNGRIIQRRDKTYNLPELEQVEIDWFLRNFWGKPYDEIKEASGRLSRYAMLVILDNDKSFFQETCGFENMEDSVEELEEKVARFLSGEEEN